MILIVVLSFGSNRRLYFVSVPFRDNSNSSVGSNGMTSSVILKVMGISVLLGPKVIVSFISSPCIAEKRERDYIIRSVSLFLASNFMRE